MMNQTYGHIVIQVAGTEHEKQVKSMDGWIFYHGKVPSWRQWWNHGTKAAMIPSLSICPTNTHTYPPSLWYLSSALASVYHRNPN